MAGGWTFFTNHAHVLFCISQDASIRLRDVATTVGITERATQRIVAELEEAGYLTHERVGRRNKYTITTSEHLRHPVEEHVSVGELIDMLQPRIPTM